jgi:hypothetical protein
MQSIREIVEIGGRGGSWMDGKLICKYMVIVGRNTGRKEKIQTKTKTTTNTNNNNPSIPIPQP